MATTVVTLQTLALDQVCLDEAVLPRDVDGDLLARYTDRLAAGDDFPAIMVGQVGAELVLIDGRHRLEAHRRLGRPTICAEVAAVADRRQAYLMALAANRQHGQVLAHGDLRRAVKRLLADPEWRTWTNVALGALLGRSDSWVRQVRLEVSDQTGPRTYRRADGATFTFTPNAAANRHARVEAAVRAGTLGTARLATASAARLVGRGLLALEKSLLPLSPAALAAALDQEGRWEELETATQRLVGLVAAARLAAKSAPK
jgi:hypothetical protein